MKGKIFFAFLLVLFMARPSSGQDNLNYLLKYNAYLKSPDNFLVLGEDTLLFNDPANGDYPVYLIDIGSKEIVNRIRSGRGPGELGEMYKTVAITPDGKNISIYDKAQMRTNIYDRKLSFLQTFSSDLYKENFMQAGFLSDSLFFAVPSKNSLLKAFEILKSDSYELSNNVVWEVSHEKDPLYAPLKNYLLKQDIHIAQSENNMYLAFKYSSLIMAVGRDGILFNTAEPENHLFPDEKPERGHIYKLPDVTEYPICTLDIDTDKNYLYALYSGKKVSEDLLSNSSAGRAIEEISHSDKVNIFDKETGAFITSYQLPLQAEAFEVTAQHIYLLTTLDEDYPTVYKFKKETFKSFGR